MLQFSTLWRNCYELGTFVTAHRKEFIRGQRRRRKLDDSPLRQEGMCSTQKLFEGLRERRLHVRQSIWFERGTKAKEKRGTLQTRLKSKRIPHGDSACGKVWCNESSLEHKTTKTADPQLTVTSDKTKGWRAVARLGKEKTRPWPEYAHVISPSMTNLLSHVESSSEFGTVTPTTVVNNINRRHRTASK